MLTIKQQHFAKFIGIIRDRYQSAFLKLHDRGERSTASDLMRYFQQQERDILRRLSESGLPVTADMLFDPQLWDDVLKEIMRLHLYRAAFAGAILALATFGKSVKRDEFTLEGDADAIDDILIDLPPAVQVAIRDATEETLAQPYWSKINETTAARLSNTITSSLDAGLNATQMATAIREALGIETSAKRAIMIARSETTGALNAGTHAVQQSLQSEGLVTGKEWLATLDTFTRQSHVDADNQQVGVNDMFNVGGELAPYPGHFSLSAGNRINCRCTTLSVTIIDDQ